MAGVKIVDLPALGRDLISTDLLEVSLNGGGSRKITGQEIMNASKLAIGSTPIVSGTVGRLLFQGTGDVLQQSSSLFWDATNNRLGIGTSSPLRAIDVFASSPEIATRIASNGTGKFSFLGNAGGEIGSISLTGSSGEMRIFTSNSYFPTFYSGGSEAMRIATTGNVLIGTATDAGFKLDVNGTLRCVGFSLITPTGHHYANGFSTSSTDGTFNFRRFSDNGWVRFALGASSSFQMAGNTGTGEGQLFASGGGFFWTLYTNAVERMRIATTGNVLINTTTDDGFRLDVNGTARVQGATTISSGTNSNIRLSGTSIEFSRTVDGAYNTYITKNGSTNSVGLTFAALNSGNFFFESTSRILSLFGSTLNVGINTTTDAGFRLDVNGTARVSGQLTITNGNLSLSSYYTVGDGTYSLRRDYLQSYDPFRIYTVVNQSPLHLGSGTINTCVVLNGVNDTQRGFGIADDGTPSLVNSAVLQVNSTKRGFLPPRMTNAQRAAIASPAVGLIVYCTDSTEGLYVYKSTGWTFMV